MMSATAMRWLPAVLFWLTGAAAHAEADASLHLCPAQRAPASRVQADIVRPVGEVMRAVVALAPVASGCATLPLAITANGVLALRPVATPLAHRLADGLTLSGQELDNGFAISEVIPRAAPVAATPAPQALPLPAPASATVPARATWVWQPGDWRNAPGAVLDLARRHRIQTLFVTVPLANGAVQEPLRLAGFVQQASTVGIAVWAVDGDPQMVLPSEHAHAAARANAYARYNRQAEPAARLSGVQFDVEPYLLPGYDLASEVWEAQYTALVAALKAGAGRLPLDMVVPFWWGDKPALLNTLTPHVSSLTVMDYRTNGVEIARFAQPFLDWGRRQRKAVRIALEAGPVAAETLRRFEPAPAGELWQLKLAGQVFLLLLKQPLPNPHGPAFREVGRSAVAGDATSFYGQHNRLLAMLPALEAQFAAWPTFAGMALHEIK